MREATTPFVVVLNQDARPEPGWLAALLAPLTASDAHRIAAVTSKVIFAADGRLEQHRRDRGSRRLRSRSRVWPAGRRSVRRARGRVRLLWHRGRVTSGGSSRRRLVRSFVLPLLRGHRSFVAPAAWWLASALRARRVRASCARCIDRRVVEILCVLQRAQPAADVGEVRASIACGERGSALRRASRWCCRSVG